MKLKHLVLSALVLAVFAAAVSADNDTVGDDAKSFSSGLGAKVRLLQLESSIERNILAGDEVVAAIKAANESADTSELEAMLAQLRDLKDEVASTNPASGDEAAKNFVDIKDDARDLSKEFRELARGLLKADDIPGVRLRIRGINNDALKGLGERVKDARAEYNAQKVGEVLSSMGLQNPDLVDEVRSGDAKLKDVRDYLKDATQSMSKSERAQALQALNEHGAKGGVFLKAVKDRVQENRLNRVENRLEKRLDRADKLNLSEGVKLRLQNRTAWVEGRLERLEGRAEARIGNWTERRESQIDKVIDRIESLGDRKEEKLRELLDSGNLTDDEKAKVEERLGKLENRTGKMIDKLEERKDKVEEKGQKLEDRIGGKGNGGGGQ